ncbi:MAG TPA: hypothetical protein VKA48_08580 [Gammaproteobacteria bacterium]|nr:hypothetical protein [Gammaproteobacteria bacterium]
MDLLENLRAHWGKAFSLGLLNGLLLSAIMVPAFQAGIPPMPKPPSLAFAETLFGHSLPLFAGLLFHLAYVTFWSMAFIAGAYPRLTILRALGLGLALWIVILVVFFPVVGWGFLGLGVSPKLIVASLIPHLLFAVFLWGLGHAFFLRRGGSDRS